MLDGKVGPVVVEGVVVVTLVVVVVVDDVDVVVVVEDGVVVTCIVAADVAVRLEVVDVAAEELPDTTRTVPVILGCTKQL